MPQINETTTLPAPPERAWEVMTDFSRYPEWLTLHAGWPQGVPELADGARYVQKLSIMGMPADVDWSVVELNPPERFRVEGTGPMGVKLEQEWTVEAADEGARVTYSASFEGGAATGPMGATVAKQAKQEAEQSLKNVKPLLG
jgi:carbon monoxide dehydrogenase subunit G